MGPAYFTKLLYFLASGTHGVAKGYIMDQWLGCSVNLLTGRLIVKLDQHLTWQLQNGRAVPRIDSVVSDANSGRDYESSSKQSRRLDGGRLPHPWRAHVVNQRLRRFLTDLESFVPPVRGV